MRRAPIVTALLALGLLSCGSGTRGPVGDPDEPPPRGNECKELADCEAGLVCQAGMCLPFEGQAGDPCYDELDCALGLDCRSGECVEAKDQ